VNILDYFDKNRHDDSLIALWQTRLERRLFDS